VKPGVFLIVLILFLSFSRLNAQNRFGFEAGVLRSKVEYGGDTKLNSKLKTGYKLGVFAEFPIRRNFYFNPALSYVNKGGQFDNDWMALGSAWHSKGHMTTHFVELPLMFYTSSAPAKSNGLPVQALLWVME
jgi:hypothetical protein